ncbi:MAG: FMN-binding negative transcriptional regulator [Gammaproteobacteria bacterium]|nr:transcriptional regulator [Gammaproteobacteria bacterium]
MYLPQHFAESRVEVMHAFMRKHPLGVLVANTPAGLDANHVPFVTDSEPAPWGRLRCHVARANPIWSAVEQANDVLVIFQGPEAYVSPSVYEAKRRDGKVVPTWNYVTVHAYGKARVVHEHEWLLAQLHALTATQESGRPEPWHVDDAPADFTSKLIRAIVGIEITIEKLIGKWKVSQNRSRIDRANIAADLRSQSAARHGEMIQLLEDGG